MKIAEEKFWPFEAEYPKWTKLFLQKLCILCILYTLCMYFMYIVHIV